MLIFERNPHRDEMQQSIIGICGLTKCNLQMGIDNLINRLESLRDSEKVSVLQLFDSDTIATHLHILVSSLYALRAFDTFKNISDAMGTEILLYASAQRQIVDAIERIGVKPKSLNVAAVAIALEKDATHQALEAVAKELDGQMDDIVLGINTFSKAETIKAVFGISERELNSTSWEIDPKSLGWAITKRVLSRISIMSISK